MSKSAYCTEKASNTLPPEAALLIAYPEPMKTMPPVTTAPVLVIAPPCAGTLLTVANSGFVLNSQSCLPSAAETAYSLPLDEPANTTPGIIVGAAPTDPPPAGGVNAHARSPVASLKAASPVPPAP